MPLEATAAPRPWLPVTRTFSPSMIGLGTPIDAPRKPSAANHLLHRIVDVVGGRRSELPSRLFPGTEITEPVSAVAGYGVTVSDDSFAGRAVVIDVMDGVFRIGVGVVGGY